MLFLCVCLAIIAVYMAAKFIMGVFAVLAMLLFYVVLKAKEHPFHVLRRRRRRHMEMQISTSWWRPTHTHTLGGCWAFAYWMLGALHQWNNISVVFVRMLFVLRIQHTHRRFAKYCNLPHTYTSDTDLYDTPQGIIIQRFMVYERTSCRQKQRRCGANYGAYIYRGSA